MSEPNTFDRHASAYSATVQSAIGASGEAHDYFIRLKATLTRQVIGRLAPSRILDFGCGIGLSTRALAAEFPRAAVTGVDDSAESIAIARDGAAGGQVAFVHSADSALPFAEGSFDLVFTACVFHHIPLEEREMWMRELARVTRAGGATIVFEHNPYNPLTRRVVAAVPFDEGVELLRGGETRRLLEAAGMRAQGPQYYFFFPRQLALLRPLERWIRWLPLGGQYYVLGSHAEGGRLTGARSLALGRRSEADASDHHAPR